MEYHVIASSSEIICTDSKVEIKISCAVLPFLAIALYPLMVFTDNLIINFGDLPLTLDIAAGVIVLILMLRANFCNTGINAGFETITQKQEEC